MQENLPRVRHCALTRINNDRVLVDPRTLPDNALNAAANVIRHVIGSLLGSHT
jgi:hypothetical protein